MSEQLELVLPRRVAPQPAPAIVPGGDCGPCCVAGVTGLDVDEAYALAGDTPHAWSSTDVPVELPPPGEPMPRVPPPADWGDLDLTPVVVEDGGVLCPTCLAELARWYGQVEEPGDQP